MSGGIPNCTIQLTGERLSAWRDRLLSARELTQITAHLPQCQACQERLAQFDEIAYQLRHQPELEPGNRIWNHTQMHIIQKPRERIIAMNTRARWGTIGAVVAALLIVGFFVVALNNRATGPGSSGTLTPAPTVTTAPFTVTSIDMAVDPAVITGKTCGSTITATYTATFHIAPQGPGGTIQFMYTSNNGRSSTNASVTAAPGQTTVSYSYTTSGALTPDHTFPGIGEVITSSPNSVTSSQVAAQGACTSSAFQVTGVDLGASPLSVAGLACGTTITVTYTATFHVVANSPGGTIQFMYTSNNGRSSTDASVTVAAGQTTATYSYSSSGMLTPDHTFPGVGEVITSRPNAVNSPQVTPSGACH